MTNAFGAQQLHYRFAEENGTEATSTLLGSEDTALTRNVASNSNIQLRILINEVGGGAINGATNATWQLQRNIAGGGFANITSASTGVRANTASALTDGGATTNRLTAPVTFHAGQQDDQNGAVTHTHTANLCTEHVFGLTLVAADLSNGQAVTFQLLYNGALLTTTQNGAYTVVPTLNIVTGQDATVAPGVGSTAATGLAPALVAGHTLEPAVVAATITGLAPTWESIQPDWTGEPAVGSLAFTGLAPTVTATSNVTVEPSVAALALTGFAPDVPIGLTERLTPNTVLASTNLKDTLTNSPPQRFADIDEPTGSDDTEWWTAVNPEADIAVRLGFPTSSGNLVGNQTINVLIRGSSLPSRAWKLELYESGVKKTSETTGAVSSISGQVVTLTFPASELTDQTGAGVEVRISATAA